MLAAAAVAVCGCASSPQEASNRAAPVAVETVYEDGTISITDSQAEEPAWLTNGEIGIRVDRLGDILPNGYYTADGRQPDGEEKLLAKSAPIGKLLVDGEAIEPSGVTNYRQALDLRTGVLRTDFDYRGKRIERTLSLSESGTKILSEASIDGQPSVHQAGKGEIVGGRRSRLPAIEIDGPVEDRAAVESMVHYLTRSVSPDGQFSVGPMGLSSTQYNGHVFWDADVWIFPALALLEPDRAAAIPMYRLAKLDQARRNHEEWLAADRPTGGEKMGPFRSDAEVPGAKFPWESSVTGRETVPGPSKYQDHISGTVAFSVDMAAKLGLVKSTAAEDLTSLVAGFYETRSVKSDRGFEIKGTMSPDEHHTGDNDLSTNLLADWVRNGGSHPQKPTYHLPKDAESFLTYDGDKLRGYKQAAAVLAIYPLQYPPAEAQAMKMLERFADKAIENGPAMTDSVHATIAARFGDAETAYKYWHESWKPFTRHPLLMFSEKRSRPVTYFVTGAGGSLQTVLYGFAGLRLDTNPLPDAKWKRRLESGAWLSAKPNLPSAWKGLTLRLKVDSTPLTLRIDTDGSVREGE